MSSISAIMKSCIFVLIVLFVSNSLGEFEEIKPIVGGRSGQGKTTRYWDCCKPSCSWKENVKAKNPVRSCAKDGNTTINVHQQSGCNGGASYMCSDQTPIKVNDKLAYGFAAASFSGGADTSDCCACYKLTFTDQLVGKSMIVQVTNTGGDLGQNHFDLAMPGGGFGIFTQGCPSQWPTISTNAWGDQYGGVHNAQECNRLPNQQLRNGCKFRFEWFKNANNPKMNFQQVACPQQIIKISQCQV